MVKGNDIFYVFAVVSSNCQNFFFAKLVFITAYLVKTSTILNKKKL